jgi:16S rRNA (cytosine1402-N4)-methyltransferase
MLDQVLAALKPRQGGIYVDATFGAGGYSRAILSAAECRVFAIDRDPEAVKGGATLVAEFAGRLTLVEGCFSAMEQLLAQVGVTAIDGVALDVGVSSMQIDEAERGFSFQNEGPLDMRMSRTGRSAADFVNTAPVEQLSRIIGVLGEERRARTIATAIARLRKVHPFVTTTELAAAVEKAIGRKPGDRIHPATRTFQALRIFVNEELDELHLALAAAEQVLKPGGRLVVVSFHSLEDRMVKNFLGERGKTGGGSRHLPEVAQVTPSFRILTKRPVTAGDDEVRANPRARSAKLRAAERSDAPAFAADSLPKWPSLADVMRGG